MPQPVRHYNRLDTLCKYFDNDLVCGLVKTIGAALTGLVNLTQRQLTRLTEC